MELSIEFINSLPDKEASTKIAEIALLIEKGYTQGINMPLEINWKIISPYSKEQKIIAGSSINN